MLTNINNQKCFKILQNNYIGHLVYIYNNFPFVVPVTYYYDKENLALIGYTSEGHKAKALRINNAVAIEITEIKSIDEWKSILIQGTCEILKGPDAKYELHKFATGVKKLIAEKENTPLKFISQFSSNINFEVIPIVYRINISEISGKKRSVKSNISILQS